MGYATPPPPHGSVLLADRERGELGYRLGRQDLLRTVREIADSDVDVLGALCVRERRMEQVGADAVDLAAEIGSPPPLNR